VISIGIDERCFVVSKLKTSFAARNERLMRREYKTLLHIAKSARE